jgi:predicted negative regulator of RcsB-dependent stress response
MDFQSLFYALGSFFLILGIIVMIGIVFFLWKAYQSVQKMQQDVTDLKENVVERVSSFVSSKPTIIASTIGAGLSSMMMKKVKSMFQKKDES